MNRRKFLAVLVLCAGSAQLSAQKLLPVSVAVSTKYQLNGVAVSHDDRIFVALPRWVQPDSFSRRSEGWQSRALPGRRLEHMAPRHR